VRDSTSRSNTPPRGSSPLDTMGGRYDGCRASLSPRRRVLIDMKLSESAGAAISCSRVRVRSRSSAIICWKDALARKMTKSRSRSAVGTSGSIAGDVTG
jgi:hypothetical protein